MIKMGGKVVKMALNVEFHRGKKKRCVENPLSI